MRQPTLYALLTFCLFNRVKREVRYGRSQFYLRRRNYGRSDHSKSLQRGLRPLSVRPVQEQSRTTKQNRPGLIASAGNGAPQKLLPPLTPGGQGNGKLGSIQLKAFSLRAFSGARAKALGNSTQIMVPRPEAGVLILIVPP